ncbi:Acriflavine sensitivity control protein acr-2 like [Verticillium longisporum]|nr:Acriflavine sensitivity control protein acr-2 like [Verticillium longisporum]
MVGVTSDSMLKIQKATTTSSLPAPSPAILSTEQAPLASSHSNSPRSLPRSLEDPSAQDLDFRSRTHLDYFARVVCKDLVLYDTPQHNPFRDLVPMAYQKPILFQAITATSALRMSNATRSPSSRSIGPCLASRPKILHDALSAKQQALLLLKSALETMAPADVDAILANRDDFEPAPPMVDVKLLGV